MADDGATVQAVEHLQDLRTVVTGVAPDPSKEVEVEPLGAVFGEIRAPAAPIPNQPPERAPEARRPREVEEDHRVHAVESGRVLLRRQEVAVEDPPLACDGGPEIAKELLRRRRCPAAPPEQDVEVDDGQPGPASDLARKLALAGSAVAEDRDPLHCRSVCPSCRPEADARGYLGTAIIS